MKNISKIALVMALIAPMGAFAATGDDKIATSKEYVDSGLTLKANKSVVTPLVTTVGDATGGLVKDVADLQTIVGDDTAGLVKDVADLADIVDNLPADMTNVQYTTNMTQDISGADANSATKYTSAAAVTGALAGKQNSLTCASGLVHFTAAGTYECLTLQTGSYAGD